MNVWRFLFGQRFASGGVYRGDTGKRVGEDSVPAILARGGEVVVPKNARPSDVFKHGSLADVGEDYEHAEPVTINVEIKG